MHKENTGVAVLNGDCAEMPNKTIIVLGIPRGGTSMVAGVLSKLGIFMGLQANLAPFYENGELAACFKGKDKAKAKKIIASYNGQHAIWGIKVLPTAWRFWLCQDWFREPVYVVVFRDVLAISNRWVISLNKSLLREMFIAIGLNFCLLLFLTFTKRPALIISYEKALLFPEGIVTGLCDFLGLSGSAPLREAIQFINPSPPSYVMRSTTDCQLDADANYFGYLDHVDSTKVVGWALSISENNPINIELLINGQQKQVIQANALREDVHKANNRYRENCGFIVTFNEKDKLNKGDRVEVRIKEKNIHLINSPFIVT